MYMYICVHVQVDAHAVLQEACQAFPWNWSAWLDLAEICVSGGENSNNNASSGSSSGSAVPEGFNGQIMGGGSSSAPNETDSTTKVDGSQGAAPEDACLQVALEGPAPWTRKVFLAHALVSEGALDSALNTFCECTKTRLCYFCSIYCGGFQ
jgi:hypothetical protein